MLLLSANIGTETHGQISCSALVCLFHTFSYRTQATANKFFFLSLEKMLAYFNYITLCSASVPSIIGLRSSGTRWRVSVGRAVFLEESNYTASRPAWPQYSYSLL